MYAPSPFSVTILYQFFDKLAPFLASRVIIAGDSNAILDRNMDTSNCTRLPDSDLFPDQLTEIWRWRNPCTRHFILLKIKLLPPLLYVLRHSPIWIPKMIFTQFNSHVTTVAFCRVPVLLDFGVLYYRTHGLREAMPAHIFLRAFFDALTCPQLACIRLLQLCSGFESFLGGLLQNPAGCTF